MDLNNNNMNDYIDTTSLDENPGVFIDIDGVVLQGGKPFEWSKEAIHALWNNDVPFCFVTNGTYCSETLVNTLKGILELPFTNDHIVVAPSPCLGLTDYHDKRVLVCCQDDSYGLIAELGFTNYLTVPQLVEVFPELDYVDHEKRKILLNTPMTAERERVRNEFCPVEAVLLLGEPINWECALQVIIDILMTNGDPRNKFKFVPSPHLPIIACNKDLTFKGAAALPRFGHGAFLECLEALYMKITKNELVYEHLMGKPCLITYQFAAEQIQRLSKNGNPINKFFMIGDNPDVDIRGANVFKEHLHMLSETASRSSRSSRRPSIISENELRSSVYNSRQVEAILVCTGVYNPQNDMLVHLRGLFNDTGFSETSSTDENNNSTKSTSISRTDSSSRLARTESSASLSIEMDRRELRNALSRKNSFISYFDNKQNIPDLTVNNLKDAVDYIIKCCNSARFE